MTPEKAIEALSLKGGLEIRGFATRVAEFTDGVCVAQEALQKQIPKKTKEEVFAEDIKVGNVVFKAGTKVHRCPECLGAVTGSNHFCSKCGQALIW